VTSWDELEGYLSALVEKVGGATYVLQGSGGRYLAPRLLAKDDATLFELLNRWLFAQRREHVEKDQPGGADNGAPASEASRYLNALERIKQYAAALDAAAGAEFVKRGPGKRYIHRQADLPFIAERFLASYILIIAFDDPDAVDRGGAVLALERARSAISTMLEDLPPDGGGDRALSNVNRGA
jgi:hypothetical protein